MIRVTILIILTTFAISCNTTSKDSNTGIAGQWLGNCSTDSFNLEFQIQFSKDIAGYKASYRSDEQRALDIPLQNISFDTINDSISFSLMGDADSWNFKGKLSNDSIKGIIIKGKLIADFFLIKQSIEKTSYTKENVVFQNDSVKLSGTIYFPEIKNQIPAILFMHGSGGESRFGAAYYADYFAKKGIAVLIYDKRGVGKSTGDWLVSSFQDLANDAIAGVKLLQSYPQIDKNKIGIYGHSQGGSICPMVLNMYPQIAFGISVASAGVSMEESDWHEVQNRFRKYPLGNNYDNAMKVMEKYLHFASTGKGYAELVAEAERFEKEKWYQDYIGSIDTTKVSFFHYYRKIGSYNSIDYWKNVKQPSLILKGANDQTSPGYPSFQNIEDALKQAGNNQYKIVMFKNTNHEMHLAGSQNDFFFKATPGYCDTIYNWLSKTIIPKQVKPDTNRHSNASGFIISITKMKSPRAAHTATLLKSGKVLICGGFSGSNTLASAEIYDPVLNTFRQINNMSVPRASHTATLLPDGKVLIAGGYNGDYLSSTEIFNPQTETFTSASIMKTPRSGHTATILNNGKILFAGGVGIGWSFLQTAEIYDLSSKSFSSTGSMNTARESHTATLMNNGTVLITGGHKGRRADIKIYSSAEIYNPSTEKFTLTGNMTKIRHKHDAVMLSDGSILITGGSDERDSRGAYTSSEIYDPVSQTFKSAGKMNLSRYKHNGTSVLLANGNVLIAGGANRAEIFDVEKKHFEIVAGNFETERLFSCATLLQNGNVLITGGYDENQKTSDHAWIYKYTNK